MDYIQLGKSALHISRIGFGTMSLVGENPASEGILLDALRGGINFFDTADMYQQGKLETLLGHVFRTRRDQVILATKVGNQWRADGSGWDWNPTKKYILSAIDQSLKRLQTDYVDLYQLHGGTLADPIDEVIETFEFLKKTGKIRYYGISSIRPSVIREYVNKSSLVSVMMQYSLLDRRPEEEILPLLLEKQVGVLTRGSLAKGLLVDKPPAPFLNYNAQEVAKAAEAIAAVSGEPSSRAATSIRFVLDHPAVSSAVIGIRTQDQLKEALATFGSSPWKKNQQEFLKNVIDPNYYSEHR